jgi:hypothetical protein
MTEPELTDREVAMLSAAIRATLVELEGWEFHTRVGFDREEAEALLRALEGAPTATDPRPPRLEGSAVGLAFFVLVEVVLGFTPPEGSLVGDRAELERFMDRLDRLR